MGSHDLSHVRWSVKVTRRLKVDNSDGIFPCELLRYASHVACLHVLSACAGAQTPVSALNSNASSLPPLQCDHVVTWALNTARHRQLLSRIFGLNRSTIRPRQAHMMQCQSRGLTAPKFSVPECHAALRQETGESCPTSRDGCVVGSDWASRYHLTLQESLLVTRTSGTGTSLKLHWMSRQVWYLWEWDACTSYEESLWRRMNRSATWGQAMKSLQRRAGLERAHNGSTAVPFSDSDAISGSWWGDWLPRQEDRLAASEV